MSLILLQGLPQEF
jgi:hypothetical protein